MRARPLFSRLALAALVALTGKLTAQQQTIRSTGGTSHLMGFVHDDGGRGIADVQITTGVPAVMARTDSTGHFTLTKLPGGPTDLVIRRLAFEPAIVHADLADDDTTRVDVTLTVVAQQLRGVLVMARTETRRELLGFESRRRIGVGHFITRQEIEQRRPNRLSEMMRTIPGVSLIPGENGREALRFSGIARANCPPMFYLDGILATGFTIDEMPPGDVEGIELYGGAAGVPPEYSRSRGTSTCGTVLIWTRIPGQ